MLQFGARQLPITLSVCPRLAKVVHTPHPQYNAEALSKHPWCSKKIEGLGFRGRLVVSYSRLAQMGQMERERQETRFNSQSLEHSTAHKCQSQAGSTSDNTAGQGLIDMKNYNACIICSRPESLPRAYLKYFRTQNKPSAVLSAKPICRVSRQSLVTNMYRVDQYPCDAEGTNQC